MGLGTLRVCPVWMMGQPKSWSAFKIQGSFLVSFCQCLFWLEAQFGEDLGDRKAIWYKVHLSPGMTSEQPFRSWLTPHTSISVQGKLSLNVPFLVASIWNNIVFLSRNVTPQTSLLGTQPNWVVITHQPFEMELLSSELLGRAHPVNRHEKFAIFQLEAASTSDLMSKEHLHAWHGFRMCEPSTKTCHTGKSKISRYRLLFDFVHNSVISDFSTKIFPWKPMEYSGL